jgi:two-component system, LytTR family, sensor histidine kinase AlgZ
MEEEIEEGSKAVQMPPLLLQPLIENAVTHGIAHLPEGGLVRLSSVGQNGRVALSVENSFDPEVTAASRGGLGLRNVRQRLEARYGKEASMRVSAENGKFRVELSFPADAEEVRR